MAEAVPVLLVGRLGLRWSVKAVSLFVSTRCVCRALAWYVRVLCMRCVIVHAVSCSCPGPALVSIASISAVAVVAGGQYAPDLDCSVTVYSPGGLAVGLTFSAFSLEESGQTGNADCTYSCPAEGYFLMEFFNALIRVWLHCLVSCHSLRWVQQWWSAVSMDWNSG